MVQRAEECVVAVVGTGTMGAGIAQVAAQAGHPVWLYDQVPGSCQRARQLIEAGLTHQVSKGRLTAQQLQTALAHLHCADQLAQLAEADLVIEAVQEDLAIKQALFQQLEAVCSAHCLFASNTSSISITALGSRLQAPQRLAGMHFFNPAPVMQLVEVVAGLNSAATTVTRLQALAANWGKHAVVCRSRPGFIVNRVARAYYGEALRALEEQVADAATLDAVLVECGGFRMGPLALTDLIGQDVNYAVTCSLWQASFQDARYQPSALQRELVEAGHLGKKSGRGIYLYPGELPKAQVQPQITESPHWQVQFTGDWRRLPGWLPLLAQQGYHPVSVQAVPELQVHGVRIALTEGVTASELARRYQQPVVLFDLLEDYQCSPAIALSAAQQNTPQQTALAIAFFQALGKRVLLLQDYPGMLMSRTLAMLCNEALDLVQHGIAQGEEIDFAMRHGVNYPQGPLAWGERLGWPWLLALLDNLHAYYGETRYRAAPLLRQRALLSGEHAAGRSG